MSDKQSQSANNVFERVLKSRQTADLYPDGEDNGGEVWPQLWAFLTHTKIDDETYKDPAKLSITLGAGEFVVELVDGALGIMVNATSTRLSEALDCMEAALTSPNPPIRYFRDAEPKLKKRKKAPKN